MATWVSGHGVLEVTGTNDDDSIQLVVNADDSNRIDVIVNGAIRTVSTEGVQRIRVRARAGDDTVEISQDIDINARVFGDRGEDVLTGGSGRDTLVGGRGDDEVFGGDGDDLIFGGKLDDFLDGGNGDDQIVSGTGQDVFQSTDGLDEMVDRDEEDGIRIELDEAPSAVQIGVLDLLQGDEIRNLLREVDDTGGTIFELEWSDSENVGHSAKILPDGSVVELEAEIDPAELPDAVTQAIKARYPLGEITEAETLELPDTPLRYEVEVENESLVRELVVTPDGEILADDIEGVIEQ